MLGSRQPGTEDQRMERQWFMCAGPTHLVALCLGWLSGSPCAYHIKNKLVCVGRIWQGVARKMNQGRTSQFTKINKCKEILQYLKIQGLASHISN